MFTKWIMAQEIVSGVNFLPLIDCLSNTAGFIDLLLVFRFHVKTDSVALW